MSPVEAAVRQLHLLHNPTDVVRGLGAGGAGVDLLVVLPIRAVVERGGLAGGANDARIVIAGPVDGVTVSVRHVATRIVAVARAGAGAGHRVLASAVISPVGRPSGLPAGGDVAHLPRIAVVA